MSAQLPLGLPEPPIPARVYFDSTALKVEDLRDAINTAQQQNAQVLAIFRKHKRPLTPSQVWRYGRDDGSKWLLTSVRRSITVLTGAQALMKLESKAMGAYGRPEFEWTAL